MLRKLSKLFRKVEMHRNIVKAHLNMIDVEVKHIKELVLDEKKEQDSKKNVLRKYDEREPFLL